MEILKAYNAYLHDFEVARNWTYDCYYNLFTEEKLVFEIFNNRITENSDFKSVEDYILWANRDDNLFINFNGLHYDALIMSYICKSGVHKIFRFNEAIYRFSKAIIGERDYETQMKLKEFKTYSFKVIDLLSIIRAGFNVAGLKKISANFNYPVIEELPFDHDKSVELVNLPRYRDYQWHDLMRSKLILDECENALKMRQAFGELYNIDLLTASNSEIGKIFLTELYAQELGVHKENFIFERTHHRTIKIADIVPHWVKFKTPELQSYYKKLKNTDIVIQKKGKKTKIICHIDPLIFGNLKYKIKLGGIHSVDSPALFQIGDEEMMYEVDVTGQYPSCIINQKFVPYHLQVLEERLGKKGTFIKLVKQIVDKRTYHKSKRKESEFDDCIQKGLKIACNSIFGLYGYENFWLFDRAMLYAVTLTNQLAILMLIEDMHLAGIELLSANTDGICIRHRKDRREDVKSLVSNWEKSTGYRTEDTFYELYVRRDINNYLCRTTKGDVKAKGIFISDWKEKPVGMLSGFKFPIIAEALRNFFLLGEKVEDTIRGTDDIFKFCACEKTGEQFELVAQKVICDATTHSPKGKKYVHPRYNYLVLDEKPVQRTSRYFISKTGDRLMKYKLVKGEKQYSCMAGTKHKYVTIFNDINTVQDYDIDYDFYIEQANKIITKII